MYRVGAHALGRVQYAVDAQVGLRTRSRSDPYRLIVTDDKLFMISKEVRDYLDVMSAAPNVIVAHEVLASGVATDYYGTNDSDIVSFQGPENESALADFFTAALVTLTHKTHEALVAFDRDVSRVVSSDARRSILGLLARYLQAEKRSETLQASAA